MTKKNTPDSATPATASPVALAPVTPTTRLGIPMEIVHGKKRATPRADLSQAHQEYLLEILASHQSTKRVVIRKTGKTRQRYDNHSMEVELWDSERAEYQWDFDAEVAAVQLIADQQIKAIQSFLQADSDNRVIIWLPKMLQNWGVFQWREELRDCDVFFIQLFWTAIT